MISVTKRFRFSAAHRLPHHGGHCKNPHGHNYALEVTYSGALSSNIGTPETGMVIDFSHIAEIVNQRIIQRVDHTDLNSLWNNPTAENMVEKFAQVLGQKYVAGSVELPDNVTLERVRLWETDDSYAEWTRE